VGLNKSIVPVFFVDNFAMFTCRECETEINQATEICPHCGADLSVPVDSADAPSGKKPLRKTLLRWGILLSVLLGAMWGFLWFVIPARQGNSVAQAEGRAAQALRDIQAELRDYALPKNGGYPQKFELLGQNARNAVQLAQSANYQVQYTPGPVEADGEIHTYILQARAGNYSFRNFYTDASGTLRATRENRAATAEDPLY
jgi:hypothetical protein